MMISGMVYWGFTTCLYFFFQMIQDMDGSATNQRCAVYQIDTSKTQ